MRNKLKHISSLTELTYRGKYPFLWDKGSFLISNACNELEEEQKSELEKLNQLLLKLKKLSESDE